MDFKKDWSPSLTPRDSVFSRVEFVFGGDVGDDGGGGERGEGQH